MKELMLCIALIVISACTIGPLEEGENGETGRGVFYYQCINVTYDSACHDSTTMPDFPEALAVSAKFSMEFSRDQNDGSDYLRVISGSPSHVSEIGGVMTLERESYAPMFSVSGPNEVVDIVHVLGMPVADVALVESNWNGKDIYNSLKKIVIEKGGSVQLRGVALDEFGRCLAGLIVYNWSTDDEKTAALRANTEDSVFTLNGIMPGSTMLNAKVAGISKQFEVVVSQDEIDTDSESDTETDTTTETDTDAGMDSLNNCEEAMK